MSQEIFVFMHVHVFLIVLCSRDEASTNERMCFILCQITDKRKHKAQVPKV